MAQTTKKPVKKSAIKVISSKKTTKKAVPKKLFVIGGAIIVVILAFGGYSLWQNLGANASTSVAAAQAKLDNAKKSLDSKNTKLSTDTQNLTEFTNARDIAQRAYEAAATATNPPMPDSKIKTLRKKAGDAGDKVVRQQTKVTNDTNAVKLAQTAVDTAGRLLDKATITYQSSVKAVSAVEFSNITTTSFTVSFRSPTSGATPERYHMYINGGGGTDIQYIANTSGVMSYNATNLVPKTKYSVNIISENKVTVDGVPTYIAGKSAVKSVTTLKPPVAPKTPKPKASSSFTG